MESSRKGLIYAATAFLLWGAFPVYWKSLSDIPADEVLGHRIVWSAVFVSLLLFFSGDKSKALSAFKSPKTLALFSLTALLVATNWLIFIWAIGAGYVLECSLGYFISPLMNVICGVVFLKERLRRLQLVAVLLSAAGVGYSIFQLGAVPWIALGLASTFAVYGLLRKIASMESLEGLWLESALLLFPSLIYLAYIGQQTGSSFFDYSIQTQTLLALAGPATAAPLLLFAAGARKITMTSVGLLQYLTPTLHFLLAVFIYDERFSSDKLVMFCAIWLALGFYSFDGYLRESQRKALTARLKESDATSEPGERAA